MDEFIQLYLNYLILLHCAPNSGRVINVFTVAIFIMVAVEQFLFNLQHFLFRN